jgi:NAD(P)-dependent dehydrogenase (short-subunit alcohol dehydrogenase family)
MAPLSTLAGRLAVVTGGGSGIGRGIARVLADDGATVIITGRRIQPLEETQKIIGKNKCFIIPGDVSDEETCNFLIRDVIEHHGKIDSKSY